MTTILGGYTTDDARRAMERQARDGGYRLVEWLVPSDQHSDLRVVCAGRNGEMGFRWNGDDLNVLSTRCMALDMVMRAHEVKPKRRAVKGVH